MFKKTALFLHDGFPKCALKINGQADKEQHEPHELGCCDVLGRVSQPIKKTHYRVPVDFGAA